MSFTIKSLTTGVALAVTIAASLTLVQPANAAMKKKHHMKRMTRLAPSHIRPGYVGAPGFAGGPAPSTGPAMVATNGLLGQGGFLGTGAIPQTGVFNGVPVLGVFGF